MNEKTGKLERFTSTILGDASRRSQQILEDVEQERRRRLDRAERQLRRQMEREVEAGIAQAKKQAGQAVSQVMMSHKRELFAKRAQVVDRICQELRQKLGQWVDTPDYETWLAGQLKAALAKLPQGGQPVVLLCRPQDQAKVVPLLEGCGWPVEIRPGQMELGGLRLECPDSHMAVDCTLDGAFEQTKGHIAEYLGLRLEAAEVVEVAEEVKAE